MALGLQAAVDHLTTTFGATGATVDDIIVITTSNSVNDVVAVNDTDGVTFNDSVNDLNGNGLVEVAFTDPAPVLTDIAALGANVEVVLVNSDQFTLTDPLLAVDPGGLTLATDAGPFGLDTLISDPPVTPLGEVVSVTVDGTTFAVADLSVDPGFQFTLTGLTENPADGTIVNVDTDGDPATIEDTYDVTADLVATGVDTFEFDLQLV